MAGIYDITCDQGATLRRVVTWNQPSGSPVVLTGYSARMHVREAIDAVDVILECSTENGRLVIDPLVGKVLIYVEAAAMEDVEAATYRYDLELVIGATPIVTRLLQGKFVVKPEVTR